MTFIVEMWDCEENEVIFRGTVEEFLEDNEDQREEVATHLKQAGDCLLLGGGAAPAFKIVRA
jgi:hypothetical protein